MLAPSRVPVLFILFSRILYTKRAQRQMNFLSKNMSFLIISVSTLNYPSLEHFCPLDFASKIRPAHRTQNCETPRRNPAIRPPEPPALPRRTRSSTAKPVTLLRRLSHHASFHPTTAQPHRQHRQACWLDPNPRDRPPLVRDRAAAPSRSAHLARRLTHRSGTTPPLAGNVRRHDFPATQKPVHFDLISKSFVCLFYHAKLFRF